jgi:5-methylcytosine-specific restriction endonuclease McrA
MSISEVKDDQSSDQSDSVPQDQIRDLFLENEEDSDESINIGEGSFTPVNFSTGTRRVIDLYRAYNMDKELDPRPSFQRGYVWDRNRASKLIESILLHVPIPLIYTAEEDSGIEVVIDGQQRLTTCFAFIEGFFPMSKADKERAEKGESVRRRPFRLGKMKILHELKGKSYSDLSADLKSSFDRYNLSIIKIAKGSHPDVKFEIFERLNTGSVSLSDQEIRNCIYRGPYNDMIMKLATSEDFRKSLGIAGDANRMQDVELVLRFLAFNELTFLNYNSKMRAFLNSHMRDRRNIDNELAEKYRSDFSHAIDLSYSVFGENAFRRYSPGSARNPNGTWERAINKAVFDVIMFWFVRFEKRQIIERKDAIREMFIRLCGEDREFTDAITLGTADAGRVRTRFNKWGEALTSIVRTPSGERRLFSFQDKRNLFITDPTCAICKQQIETIDDSHIDHIHPYSKGGATEMINAQLVHRYCNLSKSDK